MRLLAAALPACAALLAIPPRANAQSTQSLPVAHPEPITIRVLDGKDGTPLKHVHLVLLAGYDDNDLRRRLWQREAITDDDGEASVPDALKNFGFLQVSVAKRKLCIAHAQTANFSLERIRRDGLSTPNRCGTTVVDDEPGVLNVFAKANGKDKPAPPASDSDSDTDAASPAAVDAPAPKGSFRLPLSASFRSGF